MKKAALCIVAAAALIATSPAFAQGSMGPVFYDQEEGEQPSPSTGGPSGCVDGFHEEGGICAPNQ